MIDGSVLVQTKYRVHRKKSSKGRVYVYHAYETSFDGKSYEGNGRTDALAKTQITEQLRIAIRDRRNGSLAKATPDRDVYGALTEHATVTAWAEAWCKELDRRAKVGRGSWTHADRSKEIWADHLRDAPISDDDYRSLSSLKLVEVKPGHSEYAIDVLGQRIHFKKGKNNPTKCSRSQQGQWRAFISGMYTIARGRGIAATNPVQRSNAIPADPKVIKDILPKSEIGKLWSYVRGSVRDILIVAIGLVFTRHGEQAGLDWSDISHDKITIRRQGQSGKPRDKDRQDVVVTKRGAIRVTVERAKTKGSTGREVDFTPLLREAVNAANAAGWPMTGAVIRDDDGLPVTTEWLSAYVPKLLVAAGLRRRNAYILKHTSCSHFLMDGGSLAELEKQIGVAAATLLRYYSHCIPAEAANRMGSWNLIGEDTNTQKNPAG